MRRCRVCSQCKATRRKSWWLASIFNHFVLAALASVTSGLILAIVLTRCGAGSGSSRNPEHGDVARLRAEIAGLSARIQERDAFLARLERERDEEKRRERERQREEESQRQRAQKERREREESDKETLRREVDDLHGIIQSQKAKIAELESQARRVAEQAEKSAHRTGHNSPVVEPLKVIAAARGRKAADEEKQAAQFLEHANRMLAADGGSVRAARWVWHEVIEKFPETSAARQARKFLADTRSLLDAENEKDAAEALREADSALYQGATGLARLRYRNIIVHFPGTQAARKAQEKYSLWR